MTNVVLYPEHTKVLKSIIENGLKKTLELDKDERGFSIEDIKEVCFRVGAGEAFVKIYNR